MPGEKTPLVGFAGEDGQKRKKGHGITCLLIVLFLLLLVFVALSATFISLYVINSRVTEPCITSTCISLTQEVLGSIDESVSPCNDFYNFACGGWERTHALEPGQGVVQTLSVLGEQNRIAIQRLIRAISTNDILAVRKASYLYKSCGNQAAIDELGGQPLVDVLSGVGGWDAANISQGGPWNYSQLTVDQMAGSQAFFSFSVGADPVNSSRQAIFLSQSGLTLDLRENYNQNNSEALLRFAAFVEETLALLGNSNEQNVSAAAEQIVQLEQDIAEFFYSNVQTENISLTFNPMTIANISELYPLPNEFDWLQHFQSFFSEVHRGANITNETLVIVQTPDYFHNLSAFLMEEALNATQLVVVENYVKWQLALPYLPLLSSDFRRVVDAFYEATGVDGGVDDCVDVVQSSLPFVVSRLYTKSELLNGTRKRLNTTVNNILTAFNERIQAKTWLDDHTKNACEQKVNAITRQLAYPDFVFNDTYMNDLYADMNITTNTSYFDSSVEVARFNLFANLRQLFKPTDKEQWDLPPTVVNAYYDPSFNQFVFLEGILHPPIFHPDWPDYFLYGAMGVVIGHELTRGFDNTGQKYDLHGDLNPWWSKKSQEAFNERTQCYVKQYSNYIIQGFQINGGLTLGENIADNGGLHTSFQAFKKVAHGPDPDLPVFGGKYTHDQMFFIAFGQLWCSLFSDSYLEESTHKDPHSPGPIRVLGSLSNSDDFAAAFRCPSGGKYTPKHKCELW